MEKVVANLSVLDRNYVVFWNKDNTKLQAYVMQPGGKSHFVKDTKEVLFLNKIIEQLNRKYVKREVISYNGEDLTRFVNRYTRSKLFCNTK